MLSQLDALLTHLGTGRWSLLQAFAMAYSSIFLAPISLGGAFLAPRLDYSCRVPPTTTTTITTASSTSLASSSPLPSSSTSSELECLYTIDTPNGQVTEECLEFDFDNSTFTSTLTSEFNLACGRSYLQTTFQSMYMFGIFIGSPFTGYLSDKYGRKRMISIGLVIYVTLGLISAWLPLLSTILVSRFILGLSHSAVSYISFVLMVEILEPKMRVVGGFSIYNVWVLGMMLYGGVAYLIRDWRLLQTVILLPAIPLLPWLWFVDESPRWMIVNGRGKEALSIIEKAARWHRVDIPSKAEMTKMVEEKGSDSAKTSQRFSLWHRVQSIVKETLVLFRTPRLRIITLCVYLDYMMAAMVYFGLSLSGSAISDDPFIYMILMGLMEVPAYTLTIPIVNRFGRKRPLSIFFLTSALVLLALPFTPSEYNTAIVSLAMLGKVAITGGFQTIIFFSSELYPTEVRSRGITTSFMASRIGAIVSPYITDLMGTVYPWAPFVVFGSGALLAGAGTYLLPETKGQTLPDTVMQLEHRRNPKQQSETS